MCDKTRQGRALRQRDLGQPGAETGHVASMDLPDAPDARNQVGTRRRVVLLETGVRAELEEGRVLV